MRPVRGREVWTRQPPHDVRLNPRYQAAARFVALPISVPLYLPIPGTDIGGAGMPNTLFGNQDGTVIRVSAAAPEATAAAELGTDFCLVARVRVTSIVDYHNVLAADSGSAPRYYQFRITPTGQLEFIRFDTIGNPYFATSAAGVITTADAGSYYTLMAISRGAEMEVWSNGLLLATGTISNTPTSAPATFHVANRAGGSELFIGEISLVAALSPCVASGDLVGIGANPWSLFRRANTRQLSAAAAAAAFNAAWNAGANQVHVGASIH